VFSAVRRVYYSSLGAVGRIFYGTNPPSTLFAVAGAKFDRVAVLGRGVSAELFAKVSAEKKISAVILCNFENRDLESPALRRAISQVNVVALLSNISEPAPSFQLAKSCGVNCVVETRKLEGHTKRDRSVWRLNRLGLPVEPLPETFPEELSIMTRGTGIVGVALASTVATRVDVFGIEFYRTDYISGTYELISAETEEVDRLRSVAPSIQRSFENVALHQPEVHFTLHCYSDHPINLKNVTLLKTKEVIVPNLDFEGRQRRTI
jgi:hypothetical protein